ncbi:hypothetical protein [Erythrobacter sp. THAF29]|uniref:hypothetical protein n=1 Tax=Erythrobacter sp. THAF29 TaxID=2587851 RepID=UPI001267EAD5|nr:hypothetical protein [Erythrobacter sp. THAF29]QFT77400.1 hypothetical protein FIU90_07585 [Erythrobacter sp. THAF29]
MAKRIVGIISIVVFASGCASTSESAFQTQRHLFQSPYVEPELANGPVGPECEGGVIRDEKCYIEGAAYPLDGRYYRDPDGNIIALSRHQRRLARERAESIQARIDTRESLESGTPLPPDSPALRENQSRPAPLPKGG